MELGELRAFIREKAREGKIVLMTIEGLRIVDADRFMIFLRENPLFQ